MRARDIMTSPAVTVHRDTPIGTAAGTLAQTGFRALPVVDTGHQLIGLVTANTIDTYLFAYPEREALRRTWPVSEVMTTEVAAAQANADLADLVATMLEQQVRTVPVTDGPQVVGVITRRDLVHTVAEDQAIACGEIRKRLERYGGRGRWTVSVHNGVATITDTQDDAIDRHIVRVLAESVPGVVRAQVVPPDGVTAWRSAAGPLPPPQPAIAQSVR